MRLHIVLNEMQPQQLWVTKDMQFDHEFGVHSVDGEGSAVVWR